MYFITICCHDRACYFGTIIENETDEIVKQPKMVLNETGNIANRCWLEIPQHFPHVVLHPYMVMPNHVHGIIELKNIVGVQDFKPLRNDTVNIAGAQNFVPSQNDATKRNAYQKIIPRSIGSIIRGYKIGVTKWVRSNNVAQNIWQRNYHEHIIRDQQSYVTIANYILNNPSKWKEDRFYME